MKWEQILKEVNFRADRSSGSGGQHANKVATRVTALFAPAESEGLNEKEKERIKTKLQRRISDEGILAVSSQEHRSQGRNKKEALNRLFLLLTDACKPPPPPRKKNKVRVNKAEIRKDKTIQSEKKTARKKLRPHLFS